jgi:hypothetical protein
MAIMYSGCTFGRAFDAGARRYLHRFITSDLYRPTTVPMTRAYVDF